MLPHPSRHIILLHLIKNNQFLRGFSLCSIDGLHVQEQMYLTAIFSPVKKHAPGA